MKISVRFALIASLMVLLQGCVPKANSDETSFELVQAYPVNPDILVLQIHAGKTVYAQQVPFTPRPGDEFSPQLIPDTNWVKRNGRVIGALVGKAQDTLFTFDQYVGPRLDPTWADQPTSYEVHSNSDPNYREAQHPIAVYRKTKPIDMARISRRNYDWPLSHVLYLKLPTALAPGKTYDIRFEGETIADLSVRYNPERNRSEAIHVSHVGFRPSDPAKVAFLSTWMGNGGGLAYSEGLQFWLVHDQSHRKVYTGTVELSKARDQAEDARDRNYTLTDVYLMDFSEFRETGRYRVCVEGIGCSFPFPIQEGAWKDAFFVSARGFYHQRSGIELGPPYTEVKRPRPFHPEDGVRVYQSNTRLMDTNMGIGETNVFEALVANRTEEIVPNAWGGYFDAGDWDRRIQHLAVARLLLELAELFPDYFETVNLNIPESNNGLPDVLDEALWSVDFYRRLQTPDGGIRGGIESAKHPKYGEASWQESLTVMAYAPDVWSSYLYAGVAARAAHGLMQHVPEQAQTYQASAFRAMEYAERVYAEEEKTLSYKVRDARNLAAIELYRLTGDDRWHDLFLETTVYTDPEAETEERRRYQQRDAAFVYARLSSQPVDAAVQQNAVNALLREADRVAAIGQNTAFKWTKNRPHQPIGWGLSFGSPKATPLLRAHFLTGKADYLQAAILACQFAAGANPENLVYTTGLGHRSPQHPNTIDQRVMGEPPPPGITVYGPLDLQQYPDYWTVELFEDVTFPSPQQWPTTEAYFDVYKFPAVTEFTVTDTMAPTAYAWGYLAARD